MYLDHGTLDKRRRGGSMPFGSQITQDRLSHCFGSVGSLKAGYHGCNMIIVGAPSTGGPNHLTDVDSINMQAMKAIPSFLGGKARDHTHTDQKKVSFIIAGTQKGGTSALDAYLREHKEVCMGIRKANWRTVTRELLPWKRRGVGLATRKELHYFDREKNFQTPVIDYRAYHSLFRANAAHRMLGEATPNYMYWCDAPRRIWQYNPDIRIIFVLRNPIERAYSAWNMERRRKTERLSFWDAIQNESVRCRAALPFQHRLYSYVDRGFYSKQLRRYWHFFSNDQTLVLKTEDLKENPGETLKRVLDFLELGAFEQLPVKDVHSTPYRSAMSQQEWEHLYRVFEDEIRDLERMLGWDCSSWKSAS